jgi:hypothetical protein
MLTFFDNLDIDAKYYKKRRHIREIPFIFFYFYAFYAGSAPKFAKLANEKVAKSCKKACPEKKIGPPSCSNCSRT